MSRFNQSLFMRVFLCHGMLQEVLRKKMSFNTISNWVTFDKTLSFLLYRRGGVDSFIYFVPETGPFPVPPHPQVIANWLLSTNNLISS